MSVRLCVCLCVWVGVGSEPGSAEMMWREIQAGDPVPAVPARAEPSESQTHPPLSRPCLFEASVQAPTPPQRYLCLSPPDASATPQHPTLSLGRGRRRPSPRPDAGSWLRSRLVSALVRSWLLPCPRRSSLGISKAGPYYFYEVMGPDAMIFVF